MAKEYAPKKKLPDYVQSIIGQALVEVSTKEDRVNVRHKVMETVVGTRIEYMDAFDYLVDLKLKTFNKEKDDA